MNKTMKLIDSGELPIDEALTILSAVAANQDSDEIYKERMEMLLNENPLLTDEDPITGILKD